MKSKKIPKLELLGLLICGILVLGACSKGTINIEDDKSGTLPLTESKDTEPTDTENLSTDPSQSESDITDGTGSVTLPTDTSNTQPDTVTESVTMSTTDANQLTLTAQALLGIPFVEGGTSPDVGFDSSGFIYYVLRENGFVNCSRSITEQAAMGNLISDISELKSGDLVFFSDSGDRAQYGGIYIGDGIMISCSMPGDNVKETNINVNYYITHFYTGVRVL